ncbi:MAG: penicillin-binding protein [Candidatus Dojkabacteria bacterium]
MKKVYLSKAKNSKVIKSRLDIVKENRGKKILRGFRPRRIKLSKKMKKILLIALGVFGIILLLAGLRVMAWVQGLNDKLPNPETVFQDLPVASEIYDRLAMDGGTGGTRLYRMFSEYNADNFSIAEVPDQVKLAFLAAEDSNFFEHGGFDAGGILRCGINNLKASGAECGASTITQQLVKLTTEIRKDQTTNKIQQKIEELLLALKVESAYPKEQILLMYLRATPYGSSIVGAKAAANFYFRKEPKDLTLAEAVVLASIIQNPSYLSPTVPYDQDTKASQDRLQERMDYVFGQLKANKNKFNGDLAKYYNDDGKQNTLTDEMIDTAMTEDWRAALKPPVATNILAGHFVDYVIQELHQTRNYKNGTEPFTRADLQVGGYRIYTSLDYNVQKIAEGAVAHGGNDYAYWNANNAALLTTTPSNGQIIAMAGSKDYFGESSGCDDRGCKFDPEVNVLTSLREPGSSNKPMGYYEAFKEGKLFPGSLLPDFPLKITDAAGTGYDIKNWDGNYKGVSYTAGQALTDSRNIPAIQVVELITVAKYVEVAQSFGYTTYTDPDNYGQSVILGGVSVKPIEHAQAYGIFANGGDLVKLNPILKIVDKEGKTIYEAQPERTAVADPQAVFVLDQTLKGVPPVNNFSWDGREYAGKTGTTNNNEDSWFVGFTPDMVSLAWVGNNIKDPMDQNYGYAYYLVAPWYSDYLRAIGDFPYFSARSQFQRPGNIVQGGGGCNAAGECQGLSSGWMIADRNPPIDNKHIKAVVCTDQPDHLARQIDKDAGRAMDKDFIYYIMPNPSEQPQLDKYFTDRGSINGAPTKDCDINRTGVFIAAPTSGATVSGSMNIKGSAFTDTGSLTGITFKIGSQVIAGCAVPVANLSNFDITCTVPATLDNGSYSFTATTTGVVLSASVPVTVGGPIANNYNVTVAPAAACSDPCLATISYGPALSGVKLWQSKDGGAATQISLGAWTSATNGGAGTYSFFVTGTNAQGGSITSAATSKVVN